MLRDSTVEGGRASNAGRWMRQEKSEYNGQRSWQTDEVEDSTVSSVTISGQKGAKLTPNEPLWAQLRKAAPLPSLFCRVGFDSSNGRGKRRAGQDGQTALKILEKLELSGLSDENLDLIQRLIQRPGSPGERP